MSGQLTIVGAQILANKISGAVQPAIGSATPTWVPGMDWIKTGIPAPAAPALSTATTGGTVAAGTYQAVITYVTASGESLPSSSSSQVTTGSTSTLTATSPGAATGATGWNVYLTQAGGVTYTKQNSSPIAIGTNYTATAPPTSTGANPPTMDTSLVPALYSWNGSAWVAGASARYVALLTASPYTSGPSGGLAEAITDLIEVTTAGYTRQAVTFSNAASTYPSPVSNSGVLTFGPMTAGMTLSAQWAALVTASSGTTGLLLFYWQLDTPQQVAVSQSIQLPIAALALSES